MGRGSNKKEKGSLLATPEHLGSGSRLNPRELLLGQGSRGMKLKGILSDEEVSLTQDKKDKQRKLEGERPTEIDSEGNKFWKNAAGEFHRDGDLPAEVWVDGTKSWHQNGDQHRDGDKPAQLWADGSKSWYQNGKLHRDGDKPAQIWADGSESWYQNGEKHRDGDKPAEIWPEGRKEWYKNGKRHRDGDKPAVTYVDGTEEFWVEDQFIKTVKLDKNGKV